MKSLFDMNELSVMGLVEVLKHLPRLLHIRKTLIQHFLDNPPDVFIGVDAPDFNLAVEAKLKAKGIPTIHYVSPTVWAWRENRIHKIGRATNLVLGVFPFEQQIYDKYQLPFKFVGHTMADDIEIEVNQKKSREHLGLDPNAQYLALLPGSRSREIESLLGIFLDTYRLLLLSHPELKLIIPAVNQAREQQIRENLSTFELADRCLVTRAPAREVMIASDSILLASGTAALEAMLCKRPMVVAYKMSKLTHMMMKRMYKPQFFALPNILANELLVPEFLQEDVNPQNLADHLLPTLGNNEQMTQKDATMFIQQTIEKFTSIHKTLKQNASQQAAKALLELVE
jgi:lipid-A-disaccharide synthase